MTLAQIARPQGSDGPNIVVCLGCGFTWDDSIPTALTPAPAARCPNEYNHNYSDDYTDDYQEESE
jgi:hypothetical protein